MYLHAAQRLARAPAACVAIEDSIPGVLAAKAAGMACIAVPAAETRGDPRLGVADVVLGSLVELDDAVWERLCRAWALRSGSKPEAEAEPR